MATNVEILSDRGMLYLSPERVHIYQRGVHSRFTDIDAPTEAIAEMNCHWRATASEPDGLKRRFWVFPADVIVINRKLIDLVPVP